MSVGSIPGSMTGLLSRAVWSVHPSSTRSRSTGRPIITALKFSIRSFCQPGRSWSTKSSRCRPVAALADRRRRPLEHVDVLRRLRQRRQRLDAGRAHADEADDLVGELGEVRIARRATGVLVVPPGGVERPALEVVHAGDGRELHEVEDARGGDEVAGADLVAAVGADHPARGALVPRARLDAGVEQRVVDEAVLRGDAVEVTADLVTGRVPRRRDVVHLLQHRHVDVGLDVTHHAGVAVPVPGAPDAPGLVDQHDLPQTGVAQLGPDDHAGHPGADDGDVDVLGDRLALGERGVGIAGVLARTAPRRSGRRGPRGPRSCAWRAPPGTCRVRPSDRSRKSVQTAWLEPTYGS